MARGRRSDQSHPTLPMHTLGTAALGAGNPNPKERALQSCGAGAEIPWEELVLSVAGLPNLPMGFPCDRDTQQVAAEPLRPPRALGFGSEVRPRAPCFAPCQGSACKKPQSSPPGFFLKKQNEHERGFIPMCAVGVSLPCAPLQVLCCEALNKSQAPPQRARRQELGLHGNNHGAQQRVGAPGICSLAGLPPKRCCRAPQDPGAGANSSSASGRLTPWGWKRLWGARGGCAAQGLHPLPAAAPFGAILGEAMQESQLFPRAGECAAGA